VGLYCLHHSPQDPVESVKFLYASYTLALKCLLKFLYAEALARAGKFIFSSGRSYRDYEALARAIEGTDVSLKVSGRPFNLAGVDLPKNVETTGWLTNRELQHFLYETDFYVVPLQPITHAGGDSSLLQAMSFGKAVVATRAPSTETYIQHGETGLLVEPHDVEGMRQAILHLWRNPDEAARMGNEARRRFEENHTMDKLAQRVYDIALEVYSANQGLNQATNKYIEEMPSNPSRKTLGD
jgi:glycosyltransferase involved in cell wall biosynthesis